MRILVVDDEGVIVDELCGFLQRRGHDVVGADGVAAALQALDSQVPFDVVLTDIRMPGGSGLDVVRACRSGPAPRPVALVMSGHAGPDDVARVRREGAQHFFPKPVSLRELREVLAAIAASRGKSRPLTEQVPAA